MSAMDSNHENKLPRSCGSDASACSPSSIWLQLHGDADEPDAVPIPEYCKEFVTWCEDKVFAHDVRYVRWDLVERLLTDIMAQHADPCSPWYNDCEKPGERCQWCEWAAELYPENAKCAGTDASEKKL